MEEPKSLMFYKILAASVSKKASRLLGFEVGDQLPKSELDLDLKGYLAQTADIMLRASHCVSDLLGTSAAVGQILSGLQADCIGRGWPLSDVMANVVYGLLSKSKPRNDVILACADFVQTQFSTQDFIDFAVSFKQLDPTLVQWGSLSRILGQHPIKSALGKALNGASSEEWTLIGFDGNSSFVAPSQPQDHSLVAQYTTICDQFKALDPDSKLAFGIVDIPSYLQFKQEFEDFDSVQVGKLLGFHKTQHDLPS